MKLFKRNSQGFTVDIRIDIPIERLGQVEAAEASNDPAELAMVATAEQGFASAGWKGMQENLLGVQNKLMKEGRYPAFQLAETAALLGRKRDAVDDLEALTRSANSTW
jgi:hypothetical protein